MHACVVFTWISEYNLEEFCPSSLKWGLGIKCRLPGLHGKCFTLRATLVSHSFCTMHWSSVLFYFSTLSWVWCCTPLIPVLRRLRQVDLCVFKGSLAYIIRPLSGGGDKNKTNYSYLCSRLTPLLPSSQYRQGHPSLLNSFSWLLLFLQFCFHPIPNLAISGPLQ